MSVRVYVLNSFAKSADGGNPAGVVLETAGLRDQDMLAVAAKLGFSETAFVFPSSCADLKIRFFTAVAEVPLCGHAALAVLCLLANRQRLTKNPQLVETQAGLLRAEIESDGRAFVQQNNPAFFETISKEELAASLRISTDVMVASLPSQIVSTGLRDILIPIRSLQELLAVKPDFEQIAAVSKKYDVVGYHLFSTETVNHAAAHCRNFAPLYDIPEESATGTSNGALACYLYRYGLIHGADASLLQFEQGYSMNKPSEILVKLNIHKNLIDEVHVGGIAAEAYARDVEI